MDGLTILVTPGARMQRDVADLMLQGVKAHGIAATIEDFKPRCRTKAVACWGWRKGRELREHGHDVLVMERGYLGDRFHYTSLGWNGLNNHAAFYNADAPADRWEQFFKSQMKPWKSGGGDYALLMGQVRGDMSLRGRDLGPWYSSMADQMQRQYGLPVRFRPHPVSVKRGDVAKPRNASLIGGTLDEAFAGAAVVVAFNSNSATDAVMAGVPTITLDDGAMAWPVSGHVVGQFHRPDREDWGRKLAYCQWSPDEISSGQAFSHIGRLHR